MRAALLSFIALCAAPVAFAQTPATPPVPQVKPAEVGKMIAQTFSEHDIELLTSALRDGLQGRAVDEKRFAPLTQKMEGFAAILMREMLTQGLPMVDHMESELKRELRRLNESK